MQYKKDVSNHIPPPLTNRIKFDLQRFASETVTPAKTIKFEGVTLTDGMIVEPHCNVKGKDNWVQFKYVADDNKFVPNFNSYNDVYSKSGGTLMQPLADQWADSTLNMHENPNGNFYLTRSGNTLHLRADDGINMNVIDVQLDFDIDKMTYTELYKQWYNTVSGSFTCLKIGGTSYGSYSNGTISNLTTGFTESYTITIGDNTYSVEFDSDGNISKINGSDLVDGKVTIGGTTYNFSGNTSSITYSEVVSNVWTVDNGLAKYGTDSETLITISSLKNPSAVNGVISGLTLDETAKTVTVAKDLLGEIDVTITGEGYVLALDNGVTQVGDGSPSWSVENGTAKYFAAGKTAGYTLSEDSKSITYSAATTGDVLFTITGLSDSATESDLSLSENVVTLKANVLNGQNISITGEGYVLALDKNYPVTTTAAHFEENIYKSSSNTEGYEVSSDGKTISYTAAAEAANLFTLNGTKTTDNITVSDDKVVTVSAANLNEQDVTITGDGYSLTVADDVKTPTKVAEYFADYTYKSDSISSAGYEVSPDNKSIQYIPVSTSTDLFTLSGIKSTEGITVINNVVTITAANLDNKNVTINNTGYTLALASGISAPQTTDAHFVLSGTTATYKSRSNTAGYILADNKITYIAPTTETDLFTVTGVKSLDGLSIDGNVITVSADSLNQTDVTISNGYKLALANNVFSPQTTNAHFVLNGTTATYKSSRLTAGYILDDNKITYTTPTTETDLFSITGVKSLDGLSINGNVITVSADSLNQTD
ncbi:MAG: hypothetical protein IJ563_10775, partial [Selenomonadaceae bacterium]|nr:hypothetical protein [Selenomonadaceae bacterium]